MKIGNIFTKDSDMVIEDTELGYLIFPDENGEVEHIEACHEQNENLIKNYNQTRGI